MAEQKFLATRQFWLSLFATVRKNYLHIISGNIFTQQQQFSLNIMKIITWNSCILLLLEIKVKIYKETRLKIVKMAKYTSRQL